jgi:hypothetical protein
LIESYFILRKGLIKYNKCNGVTPMKAHIDYVHPKLLVAKKKQLIEVIPLDYTQQLAKKKGWSYWQCNHQFFWVFKSL